MSEHGYAPTTREIAKGLGLASTNGISEHLVRLGDLGLLTKEPRRSRTLKLTRAGETAAHR
jgi:repressor LexA